MWSPEFSVRHDNVYKNEDQRFLTLEPQTTTQQLVVKFLSARRSLMDPPLYSYTYGALQRFILTGPLAADMSSLRTNRIPDGQGHCIALIDDRCDPTCGQMSVRNWNAYADSPLEGDCLQFGQYNACGFYMRLCEKVGFV